MVKKTIALVCLVVLTFSILAACGQSAPATQAPAPEGPAAPVVEAPKDKGAEELLKSPWTEIEAQAKREGEVIFAVWSKEPEWTQMSKLFEDRYGIKVTLIIGEKIAVMNKVLAELSGTGSMDVINLAGETVKGLMNADALLPGIIGIMTDNDKLTPGLSKRKEGVSNEKGYWVPMSINPAGFVYNAKNIEKPPQSFAEFEAYIDANPKKFGFCIPEKGGSGQAIMESIIANLTGGLDQYLLDSEVDPAKHAKWSSVWDWLNARKDKITFTTSNTDSLTRLNSGEIELTVAWNSSLKNALQAGQLFSHYGYYVPDFGLCVSGEVLSVLKNSPHPAAALLWINWLIEADSQKSVAELLKEMPSRVDVDVEISLLSESDKKKNIDWMSAVYKTQYISDFTKNILQ